MELTITLIERGPYRPYYRSIDRDLYADPLLYLQMISFYEGRLQGCRVFDPSGDRVGCCCEHDQCCGWQDW